VNNPLSPDAVAAAVREQCKKYVDELPIEVCEKIAAVDIDRLGLTVGFDVAVAATLISTALARWEREPKHAA
jgi:hypothetical protein